MVVTQMCRLMGAMKNKPAVLLSSLVSRVINYGCSESQTGQSGTVGRLTLVEINIALQWWTGVYEVILCYICMDHPYSGREQL